MSELREFLGQHDPAAGVAPPSVPTPAVAREALAQIKADGATAVVRPVPKFVPWFRRWHVIAPMGAVAALALFTPLVVSELGVWGAQEASTEGASSAQEGPLVGGPDTSAVSPQHKAQGNSEPASGDKQPRTDAAGISAGDVGLWEVKDVRLSAVEVPTSKSAVKMTLTTDGFPDRVTLTWGSRCFGVVHAQLGVAPMVSNTVKVAAPGPQCSSDVIAHERQVLAALRAGYLTKEATHLVVKDPQQSDASVLTFARP